MGYGSFVCVISLCPNQHAKAETKAFQVAVVVENLPSNSGDIRDASLIPEGGMATHSNILVWRIPWTEKPGGLQSIGLQSQTRLK